MDIERIKKEFEEETEKSHIDHNGNYEYGYVEKLEDTMQELQKENESLKCCGTNDWVSVDDRLPEPVIVDGFETKSVLVYSDNGYIQMQTCSQVHDTMIKGTYYYKIFTHWMELPETPKERSK